MARDIEEFLKRAAERRRQQQQPAPQQPQQPPPRRQAPPQPARQPLVVEEVEIIDDPYSGETVAEHVETHLSTDDIADHARQLGTGVAQRDDKVDQRIHKKFDHEVGHLNLDSRPSAQDTTTSVTEKTVNADAAALIDMLQNPETVAHSIMIAEILKRPEF